MADKKKRLRKILDKIYMKGKLKPVDTLEEAHIVLVDYPQEPFNHTIYKKKGYQRLLVNRYTFPEDKVHFLVLTNPRNRQQLEQSLMTNKYGTMSIK